MRFAVLVLCTGCRALLGIDDSVIVDGSVAGGDAKTPDAPSALCVGTDPFRICLDEMPAGPRTFDDLIITTDVDCDQLIDVKPLRLCVVAATEITVRHTLRAQGTYPLVLVSTGDLLVTSTGLVDVSSSLFQGRGAGAAGGCNAPMPASSSSTGAGGGAGGSFGYWGGDGGRGSNALTAGGVPATVMETPLALRGGCDGGVGGVGTGATPAEAGKGGGAVYLLARGELKIEGNVNASGGGGRGGTVTDGGGGGGGSGGMIVLGGVSVDVIGSVFAVGGGGGAGAYANSVGGSGATSSSATVGGAGATGTNGSGSGGRGSVARDDAGTDGDDDSGPGAGGGGGGGGGGAGVVRVYGSRGGTGRIAPVPL